VNATLVKSSPIIHEHHQRLERHVDRLPQSAELIGRGQPVELRAALDEAYHFLAEQLLPYMDAFERTIHAEMERLMQNRHSMAPMRREHEEIRARIKEIDLIRRRLAETPLGPGDAIRLRRAVFHLYALLKVHLAEELLYADIVEHGNTPDQAAALAAAMEHAGTSAF
jgi:iron-sulfur cluster repair protein YtfE (RIC family)